jgi:hypothetical protein
MSCDECLEVENDEVIRTVILGTVGEGWEDDSCR